MAKNDEKTASGLDTPGASGGFSLGEDMALGLGGLGDTVTAPTLTLFETSGGVSITPEDGHPVTIVNAPGLTTRQKELARAIFEHRIPITPQVQPDGSYMYMYVNSSDVYGNRRTRRFGINGKRISVPYNQGVMLDADWAYFVYETLKSENESQESSARSDALYYDDVTGEMKTVTMDSLRW
jgi:hypothetical protein